MGTRRAHHERILIQQTAQAQHEVPDSQSARDPPGRSRTNVASFDMVVIRDSVGEITVNLDVDFGVGVDQHFGWRLEEDRTLPVLDELARSDEHRHLVGHPEPVGIKPVLRVLEDRDPVARVRIAPGVVLDLDDLFRPGVLLNELEGPELILHSYFFDLAHGLWLKGLWTGKEKGPPRPNECTNAGEAP